MDKKKALTVFKIWDKRRRYVFTKRDLQKLFPGDNQKAFDESLRRLVKDQILERACRGIYINSYANNVDHHTLERIAVALRLGEYNYVSLESILSEYGVISQIPIDRLTVMTTGRKGTYKTNYGVIEFTHTKRSRNNILGNTYRQEGKPLRVATKKAALRDLKRVGRNLQLVDNDELDEYE